MSEVPVYGPYFRSSSRSLGPPWSCACPPLRERISAREKKRKRVRARAQEHFAHQVLFSPFSHRINQGGQFQYRLENSNVFPVDV